MDTRLRIAILICLCLCWQRADCAKRLATAVPFGDGGSSCPITEIALIDAEDKKLTSSQMQSAFPNYNNFIVQDLNEGAGGDFIYLMYKKDCSGSNYVSDLKFRDIPSSGIFTSKGCQNVGTDVKFFEPKKYAAGGEGVFEWLMSHENWEEGFGFVDLNSHAGGDFIYLCTSSSNNQNDAIREIAFVVSDSKDPSWNGYNVNSQDLNKGSGGKYIYIAWKK